MAVPLESLIIERLITADDLFTLPKDYRCELIRGEVVPLPPPPGGEHGYLTDGLGSRVSVFVRDHGLGKCFAAETGFKIRENPDTVRGPDWAFVRTERLEGPLSKKHVSVVPDIVLEVKSPDDSQREFAAKVEM